MCLRAVFFTSSLILTAGTSSALAADIYAPSAGGLKSPVIQEEVILPETTGYREYAEWYIRGDLGVGRFSDMNGSGEVEGTSFGMSDLDFDSVFSASVGFGRYITPHIRLGLDLDYRHHNTTTFDVGIPAGLPQLENFGNVPLEFNSSSIMFNAVYDFAPNRRFSPYLGGGVGWAFHQMDLGASTFYNDWDGDTTDEYGTVDTTKSSSNSFTANIVTGVSVNIRHGLFLDVGYKFSYLGNASMDYDYSHDDVDAGATKSASIELDDIMTHEFKIGLRYDLY
ncbi:MAG: porin family protein [bacterium]|nr:porin family protein [bacterium]